MADASALFPALLGEQWLALAVPVQRIHGGSPRVRAVGLAEVTGAAHFPAPSCVGCWACPTQVQRKPWTY